MDSTDGMETAEQIRKWKEERGEAVVKKVNLRGRAGVFLFL